MSVNLGTAEGKIILDVNGFVTSLQTAQRGMSQFSTDIAMKIGGAFSALGNTIASFGNAINNALSQPLQGFAKSAFDEMASFEDGLNRAAVISDTTGDKLRQLSDKAKEMGRTTKFSATEATQALQYMAMAGWDSNQMMDGLEGVMNLAAASGEDLALVSDIVTDALTAMGLQAKDSAHFADVLTATTLNTNTTVGMLGEAFKYVAPVAGTLGYSIEDVSLALGIMANAGIKATQAGTTLRGALIRMTIAPGQVGKAMEELGITMYDANEKARPLNELLQDLRDKFSGLTQKQQAYYAGVIFGRNAMAGMLAILKADQKEFDRLQKILSQVDGEAQKVAKSMLETFSGQLTVLKSAISGFILQFTEDVLPVFTEFVRKLQDVFAKFSQLDAGTRKVVLALVAFGTAIGPLVAGFGGLLATIGGAIASLGLLAVSFEAIAGITAAAVGTFAGWGVAIVAAIATVSAAVTTFAAAFTDLMANNDAFYGQFMAVIRDIKIAFRGLYDEFLKILEDMGVENLEITDLLLMAWEYIKNAIAPIIIWIIEQIKIAIETVTGIIGGFFKIFDGLIKIFDGNIKEGLTAVFTGVAKIISSFFIGLFDTVVSEFKAFFGILDSLGVSTQNNAARVEAANAKVQDVFTETAKKHKLYAEQHKKTDEEIAKEHEEQAQKEIDTTVQMYDEMGITTEEEDKILAQKSAEMGKNFLGNFDAYLQKMPSAVAAERYPVKTEADKLGTDLIDSGDLAGSGYVGIMDAHLSTLPERIKPHFDLALQYSDSFADSFIDNGESAGDFFVSGVDNEIKKLPAKLKGYFDTILANATAWGTSMAAAAKTMATNFNANASAAATNFSAELNKKLKASLDVANTWVSNMSSKGGEGAKLFLQAMTDAVDAQGPEIQVFGEHIAEEVIAGLQGKMEWFRNQLKGMFLNAIDKTKEDLGIYDSASKGSGKTAATSAAMRVSYASDYDIGAGVISAQKGTGGGLTAANTATNSTSAGTTINFYSPTAINEIEASRLLRQTQREIALGF